MLRLDRRYLPAIIAVGISSLYPVAHALEFEPGIGAGLAYTDNVDLVQANEEDDIVAIGYLGARLSEDSGPLRIDADASLTHQKYLDDTIGDQTYFRLSSKAEWEQTRNRLYWDVRNFYTQSKIDSLTAGRNSNLQNTNVFTLGPRIQFRPSATHSVTVNPEYRNFYYQNSDADNQQYRLQTGWLYHMRPTMQVGLDGSVNATDYDNEDLNPNTLTTIINAVLSGTGSHSTYNLKFGATHVSRDKFESTNGFTGDATWLQELTGISSLRFHWSSRLTSSSNNFLGSQNNPNNGSFGGVQINGDVVRDNRITVVYRRKDPILNTVITGLVQDLDYKESPADRRIYQLNADLNYMVTPLVTGGLKVFYNYLNEDNTNRTDKEYSIIGRVSYRLSSKLTSEFAVRYRDKSSDTKTAEFTEAAVFIGLIWGGGSVPHTGIL